MTMLTSLHPAGKAPRDGVTALRADGSTLELATARLIEISSAQGGFVSLTLTRFFRSLEDEPIDAALTMLAPLGGVVTRLTAHIGARSFRAALENRQADALSVATPVSYEAPHQGAHLVALRALPPGREVRVDAEITAPLSARPAAARLRLPMAFADAFHLRKPAVAEPVTAVLIVSPRCGVTLLDGCPVDDAPVILHGGAPLELAFPQAAVNF